MQTLNHLLQSLDPHTELVDPTGHLIDGDTPLPVWHVLDIIAGHNDLAEPAILVDGEIFFGEVYHGLIDPAFIVQS